MKIEIRPTVAAEAERLAEHRRAAFMPLYEHFRDPHISLALDDATEFYVDFPEELEMNSRCYLAAGFRETGERFVSANAPTLAMIEKEVRR